MAGAAFFQKSSGACPDCDADTELTTDPDYPTVAYLTVRHDDTCPNLRARRARP
ncbi:hypothetical protein GCM10007368_13930 [Isoptericola cucumis]|uniref:Uncharacterized protein n=2 Tax=Isoptericola cucumis TaxID=1776856 RepID=A0ABQ2B3F4_9MICO|nr:hypothetical protein GCM10007368_13930 [Isoptericola cucumis]